MRTHLNRLTIPSGLGLAALVLLGLFYGGSASADEQSTTAGTVVVEEESVTHDLCRTDDDGATYTFVSGVPDAELRGSDVYNGEDGYSVSGQADCDALEPVVEEEPPPPPPDADGDGLTDDADTCPKEAEVVNDFEDGDGCPDEPPIEEEPPDTDGDGLTGDRDACPDAAPSVDDDDDGDGCEDAVAAAAGDIGTTAVCPPVAGFGTNPACGSITICKDFLFDNIPPDDRQATFTGTNGFTASFSLSDTQCQGPVSLSAGGVGDVYLITETDAGDSFKLGQPTGGIVCGGNTASTIVEDETTTQSVQITLAAGESITCTFFNVEESSGLKICKTFVGDDTTGLDADFTSNIPQFNMTLPNNLGDDCAPPRPAMGDTFFDVLPGNYNVTEDLASMPPGFQLTDIDCGTFTNFTENLQTGALDITLADNDFVTCTFTNSQIGGGCTVSATVAGFGPPPPGCVEVCKLTLPPGVNQDFGFTGTGDIDAFTLNASTTQCVINQEVTPGFTHDVTEMIPDGWELTGIACQSTGGTSTTFAYGNGTFDSDFDFGDDTARINLALAEDVQCIFTNTQGEARLIICKQTDPENIDQDFSFTGDLGPFTLNDSVPSEECVDRDLPAGVYVVTETIPTGWELTNIINGCDRTGDSTFEYGSGGTFDSTFDPGEDDSVRITLAEGDLVSCVFINTDVTGRIIVCKSTDPENFDLDFSFSGDLGNFNVNPTGLCEDQSDLLAGQYVITENVPGGWELTNIINGCDSNDNTSTFQYGDGVNFDTTFTPGVDNSVRITLAEGDLVSCVFVNTQTVGGGCTVTANFGTTPGCIEVCKVTSPSGADQQFTFSGPNGNFDLNASATQCHVDPQQTAFTYDYTETVPADWQLTDINCQSEGASTFVYSGASVGTNDFEQGDKTVSVNLAEDDDVQCIFTNTQVDCVTATATAGFGGPPPQECATIEVVKELDPFDADDRFDLQVNGVTVFDDAVDGSTSAPVSADPDLDHTVSEIAGNGTTDLANYTTFIECVNQGQQVVADIGNNTTITIPSAEIEPGDAIVCTIINIPEQVGGECTTETNVAGFGGLLPGCGFLQVCKNFGPPVGLEIEASFETDYIAQAGPDFVLGDEECFPAGDEGEPLAPGDYTITELVDLLPPGFVFDTVNGINCLIEGLGGSSFVENGPSVTVTLASEDSVVCIFNNAESEVDADGPFVCKESDPESTQEFTFNIDLEIGEGGQHAVGDFVVTAGTCISLSEVIEAIGGGIVFVDQFSAVIEELDPDGSGGWTLVDIDCGGAEDGIDPPAVTVTFNPFEDVPTCTFFNERDTPPPPSGDDDDDIDVDIDDDAVERDREAGRRVTQPGARGKPGVGTGDGTYVPFSGVVNGEADGASVLLPALAFLGIIGILVLGFGQWQVSRRGQRR